MDENEPLHIRIVMWIVMIWITFEVIWALGREDKKVDRKFQ